MIPPLQIENVRRDRNRLEEVLRAHGSRIKGNACTCIFHDDKNPSASVYQRDGGAWAFACHKCKIDEDVIGLSQRLSHKGFVEVLAAEGVEQEEVKPDCKDEAQAIRMYLSRLGAGWQHVATYDYRTGNGNLAYRKLRFQCGGEKSIRYLHHVPGGVSLKQPAGRLPLYRLGDWVNRGAVFVVEGEKAADALAKYGVAVTTSGGANTLKRTDLTPLAGKTLYLWADNDPAGEQYVRDFAEMASRLNPKPKLKYVDIALFDLPEKGDAFEWLEMYATDDAVDVKRALKTVIDTSRDEFVSDELDKRIEDIISGKWAAVAWPWPIITRAARALLPGTITILCGDPGSTKSLWLNEACLHWLENGVSFYLYELEEDRLHRKSRAMAQLGNNSGLNNDDWIRMNPADARTASVTHRDALSRFGERITAAPDEEKTLPELLEWMEAKGRDGARILIIDPITAVKYATRNPWDEDRSFIVSAKAISRRYGLSLILVTHPRGNSKGESATDGMAGGRAYGRLTQCVLWMKAMDEPEWMEVRTAFGPSYSEVNRVLKIGKARNGKGGKQLIAYEFSSKTLRFKELGVVVDAKGKKGKGKQRDAGWSEPTTDPFGGGPGVPAHQDINF